MRKKILLVTPLSSAFAGPVTRALQQMENDVILFDYRKGSLLNRLLGTTSNYLGISDKTKALSSTLIQNQIISLAFKWKPDIIFIIKGENISVETINQLKKNTLIINWYPDWLVLWDWVKLHAPAYSYFFTMCEDLAQHVKKINPNTAYFPPASEPDEILSMKSKRYSISFVGQYSERRERYLKEIKDLGLHIWGYEGWQKSSLKKYAQPDISYTQTLEILRESKITFNMLTGNNTFQPKAINNRTFETLGVGAFLLIHQAPLLQRHFTVAQDFITFTTPSDFRKKTLYYLNTEKERERIAFHGWKTVKEKHLYIHRLQKMFNLMKLL